MYEDNIKDQKMVDIVQQGSQASSRSDIEFVEGINDFDFILAVRPDKKLLPLTTDKVETLCLDNDIQMLKTITISLPTGEPSIVIPMENHPDWYGLLDLQKYISENHFKGNFWLRRDIHSGYSPDDSILSFNHSLVHLFLDPLKTLFQSNLELMLIPENVGRPGAFTMTMQTIRLKFMTREEVIRTYNRLNVKGLKNRIQEEFGFTLSQQTLFHNKRELKNGELAVIDELCIDESSDNSGKGLIKKIDTANTDGDINVNDEDGDGNDDKVKPSNRSEEELVINVVISKSIVNMVQVHVRCHDLRISPNVSRQSSSPFGQRKTTDGVDSKTFTLTAAPVSEFIVNVEESLSVKDVRHVIQNKIGSTSLKIQFNCAEETILSENNFSSTNGEKLAIRADVWKIIYVKVVHVHDGGDKGGGKEVDFIYERCFEVKDGQQTIEGMMVDLKSSSKFNLKRFHLHTKVNGSGIGLETSLADLDIGACIYFYKNKTSLSKLF